MQSSILFIAYSIYMEESESWGTMEKTFHNIRHLLVYLCRLVDMKVLKRKRNR